MTPDKLSTRIDTIIESFESKFTGQVDKTQAALLDEIQVLLNKLELNSDGTIKQNQANRKILARADQTFEKALKGSGYYDSLNESANSIGALTGANSAYFKTLVDGFKPNAQYIKNLQNQTIGQLESMLANDGLEAAIKAPLRSILNQNINTGASYNDLLKQLRTFITGNDEVDGKLMRYSKQITTDSLFNYSRAFQESVSQNTGLEWVQYVGGAVKDSRNFCRSRMGGYYKKDDVEKWAKQNWAGKREGTTSSTIFIYAGGYNCRHQIIYVSEAAVPNTNKDAKALMKKAKSVGGELQTMGEKIAKKYGAEITPLNLKSYDSLVRKANKELGGDISLVKDSARNTIVVGKDKLKQVAQEVGQQGTKGLKTQDLTNISGYRGYISNPKLSNGIIGEIQVNTPEMIYAKETPENAKFVIGEQKWNEINKKTGLPGGLGHKYYEEIRDITETPNISTGDPVKDAKVQELLAKSRAYYSKFYYSYPDPWP